MSLFSWNSPLSQTIGRAADYVIINILFVICCIPVVTIGAAWTARYAVAMKLYRREEPPVAQSFFKAFASNFKTATIFWLFEIAVIAFFAYDWYLIFQMDKTNTNFVVKILLAFITVLVVSACINIFAFIARFEMTKKEYIKAAFVFSYIKFPRMILAIVLIAATPLLCYFYLKWLPGVLAIIPALELYFNAGMYVRGFKKLEPEDKITTDEEFHVTQTEEEEKTE